MREPKLLCLSFLPRIFMRQGCILLRLSQSRVQHRRRLFSSAVLHTPSLLQKSIIIRFESIVFFQSAISLPTWLTVSASAPTIMKHFNRSLLTSDISNPQSQIIKVMFGQGSKHFKHARVFSLWRLQSESFFVLLGNADISLPNSNIFISMRKH